MIYIFFPIVLSTAFFNTYHSLSFLQAKGYSMKEYWKGEKMLKIDALALLLTLAILIPSWFFSTTVKIACMIGAWLIPASSVIFKSVKFSGLNMKFTHRAGRISLVLLLVVAIVYLPIFFIKNTVFLSPILPCLSPIYLLISYTILSPYENSVYKKYVNKTKERLNKKGLIKIGISGSFGKTSVKNFLLQILSAKYKVFSPPQNYNTPMGISKACINLNDDVQIAILEMGARKKGDIKELMEIVSPQYGILTGFAPQHLETFETMDNVVEEKSLVLEVPICAYANDNLDAISTNGKIKRIGKEIEISNVTQDSTGLSFDFRYKEINLKLHSKILGEHNAYNMALAIACALDLGVDSDCIVRQVEEIKPLPHRQELIINAKGVKIIDDSYNINLSGVISAMNTLKSFSGRKWVTAFGIVEGGEREEELNFLLGKEIGQVADYAIIVGAKYREPIVRGIKESGNTKIYCVKDLDECKQIYVQELEAGDNLLLLANLPKQYLL